MQQNTIDNAQGATYNFVKNVVEQLAQKLGARQVPTDSEVAVRVVGEFSSGKTRVIRELLQEVIPQEFIPISSHEVQTRLPVEITYGESAELSLVKGTFGHIDREYVKTLSHFPQRQELEAYAHTEYSILLSIPEQRLLLQEGDGVSDTADPMRFCLIDTVGWNSEDNIDLNSEDYFSADWYNMALVYVTKAVRIDSQFNKDMVTKIVESFESGSLMPIRNMLPIICVITNCEKDEQHTMIQRMQKLFDSLMDERGIDKNTYPIHIMALEFNSMNDTEKKDFRENLWNAVLCDNPAKDVRDNALERALQAWPQEWHMEPYLKESLVVYERHAKALDCAYREDAYIAHMTRRRLDGLNVQEMRDHLRKKWLEQLSITDIEYTSFMHTPAVQLPVDHPLRPWWECYWLPKRDALVQKQRDFFEGMEKAIANFTEDVDDIAVYFVQHVSTLYTNAQMSTHGSFGKLCQTLLTWNSSLNMTASVSTLLALSLMEARYADTLQALQGK